MFGSLSQAGPASIGSAGATTAAGGPSGGANLNIAPGAPMLGGSSGPGISSAMVVGPGPVGGVSSAMSNGVVQTAAVQAQYMHAMMQSQNFPFPQFPPPHFGATTFNGPPAHMGAQQVRHFASCFKYGEDKSVFLLEKPSSHVAADVEYLLE